MAKKVKKKANRRSNTKYVVVIGASAGGNKALIQLVSQLQPSFNAAFFIVIHIRDLTANKLLAGRLQQATTLPCHIASTGMRVKMGEIYLAPADSHLMLKKDKVVLGHGASENRHRPSIDVLFRSAAAYWDSKVIGIILTGLLSDGVSGMSAIRRSGGTCIIQNPAEAEYEDMPTAVLKAIQPDYCISINDMGKTIGTVINTPRPNKHAHIPPEIKAEAELDERATTRIGDMDKLGKQTNFTCPDCGGVLWHITSDDINRFRCYTGHSFTEYDLLLGQSEFIEDTLWKALRMMEEKKSLSLKLEADYREKGYTVMAAHNRAQAREMDLHINRLKSILFSKTVNGANGHK